MTTTRPNTAFEIAKATTLLRDLAQAFTLHHKALKADGREVGTLIMLTLQADTDDHPKLIGTKGKHIIALQTLFQAMRLSRPASLTLLEPTPAPREPITPFDPNPEWTPDSVIALATRVLAEICSQPFTIKVEAVGEMSVLLVETNELQQDGPIQRSLHAIIHAIGKCQGRLVHVNVAPAPTAAEV